jgi:putative heme-binding domain-containing protein
LKPHSFGPDQDIWAILAYLRTLDIGASGPKGNLENGARVFEANCAGCHQVNGRGGHMGPDLSRVGSSRSRPVLAHKIRHAGSYIMSVYTGGFVMEGYQPVTLVTRDGQRIRGAKKNEDAFSVQVMDTRERLQGYLKTSLKEMVNEDGSLMPDFGPERLSDRDLNDLVAYLLTLHP